MKKCVKFVKKYRIEIIILLVSLTFSIWLMFTTFSYSNGQMLISTKAWSDFASHIPLIRSFSFGDNFPPQYPLFSGPPIRYHFLFYALVGLLEKGGLRIDFALNILSILGFSFLILMIYLFSKEIFKSGVVGFLSILFFIFNGSLAFIKFFSLNPFSENTFLDIIRSGKFVSFGPYDGSIISAFWNLNIYTNQRHLAVSFALSLLLIFFILKPFLTNKKQGLKINLLIGLIWGLSFFLNMAVFLMTAVIFSILFVFANKNRVNIMATILIGGLVTLPQYFYMQQGASSSQISFYPGYLINNNLNVFNFINYWFQNLGLHMILIPLGVVIAPKKAKIIFISFFALFIVGNLFKFSPEVAANHKFFNYFMIIGVMFSSYFIFYLWNKKNYLKPFVAIIVFFLILSGIIDFFPILNDRKISLSDFQNNKSVEWIIKNTNPNSVFLTTNFLYDNASLGGRKIFLGWPYFAWSQGYDTNSRDALRKKLLTTSDLEFFCKNVKQNNLNYAELIPTQDTIINYNFFEKKFTQVYENKNTNILIYDLKSTCKQ